MISKNSEPTVKAHQRQLLQYLRSGHWTVVVKLPVVASNNMLNHLIGYGWIKQRGDGVFP
jgi:hypothetical protein